MDGRPRVLVVDDERAQRFVLRQYLTKEGYEVLEADNGVEALDLLRTGAVDLALLDVMMPGLNGLDVVKLVRRESDVPIMLITARGEESSRVAGLDEGADDYVVKPYSMPELLARTRALLRRAQTDTSSPLLTVGDVELDVEARRCRAAGREIDLTRREFDLLATLAERRGVVLSRGQLLDAAWGTTHLTEKTVDVHLTKLRAKLGDAVTFTSVRGVGYRLDP